MFRGMRREIEARLSPASNDLNGMGGWANKLAGLVARLAAVLHCAAKVRQPWAEPVDAQTMQAAIEFCRYAVEHARLAFGIMGADPETENARYLRDVALRLARESGSSLLGRRVVWQAAKRRLQTAVAFERCLQILETRGYLRPISPAGVGTPGGGRAPQLLMLNPLWTGQELPKQKIVSGGPCLSSQCGNY